MQSTTPNKALMEQARVALRGKLGKVSCQNKNYYSVDDFSKVEKIDSHYHIYTENNSSVEQAQNLRSLVIEAKKMGFLIVNVVTNGTFKLDLPEADLILVSLDGDKKQHEIIRGETYDLIMENIDHATSDNICLYMAINQLNQHTISHVCEVAKQKRNIRAVSFNFHTPYPDTVELALNKAEKKACCDEISAFMDHGYPIFNLKSALPYIVENTFPVPCHQCVVMENGTLSVCGRCIEIPGLCETCGYFFAAEYTLVFRGKITVIADMLKTYLRYL